MRSIPPCQRYRKQMIALVKPAMGHAAVPATRQRNDIGAFQPSLKPVFPGFNVYPQSAPVHFEPAYFARHTHKLPSERTAAEWAHTLPLHGVGCAFVRGRGEAAADASHRATAPTPALADLAQFDWQVLETKSDLLKLMESRTWMRKIKDAATDRYMTLRSRRFIFSGAAEDKPPVSAAFRLRKIFFKTRPFNADMHGDLVATSTDRVVARRTGLHAFFRPRWQVYLPQKTPALHYRPSFSPLLRALFCAPLPAPVHLPVRPRGRWSVLLEDAEGFSRRLPQLQATSVRSACVPETPNC